MGKFNCPLPIVRNNFYTWDRSYLRTRKKQTLIFVGTGDTPKEFHEEDFLDVVVAHEYSHYLLGHKDYHGDTDTSMRQKESDCWFYLTLKAEEWHLNPVIAHWIISYVEKNCSWGGFSLSITGKSAYVLPDPAMPDTSDITMSEIYQELRLWLRKVLGSPPLRIVKTIAIIVWRESKFQGKALLRQRIPEQRVLQLMALRGIGLLLLTGLSRTRSFMVACQARISTVLRPFPISYLTANIVPAAVRKCALITAGKSEQDEKRWALTFLSPQFAGFCDVILCREGNPYRSAVKKVSALARLIRIRYL